MARQARPRISDGLLEELLAGEDPGEAFRSGELLGALQKAIAERALGAEMAVHLGNEEEVSAGNQRNGHNRKRVLTGSGSMEVAVPRDRQGRFEPQLIEKWVRRLPGFDEKVISMYGGGMTTREIRAHVEELYGVTVSRELISKVTDEIHEELREWRSRPLEAVYPIVYFDALRVKIRDEGVVQNKAVHLAIGVTPLGRKEILGMWTAANETVFPEVTVQTCIVHLIRYSLAHASWKRRKDLASALRPIYQAATEEEAEAALDEFEAGPWGRKFPAIVRSWRRNWEQIIPFFAFSTPIRRVIYTTNAIESLNSTVRRAVRTRGHFPNDRAAEKLIYLTLRKVERKWSRPQSFWSQARAEFAILFGDRFPVEVV